MEVEDDNAQGDFATVTEGVEDTFRDSPDGLASEPLSPNEDTEDSSPSPISKPDYLSEQFWDTEKGEVRNESLFKAFTDTKSALDKKRDDSGVPTLQDGYIKVNEEGDVVFDSKFENLPSLAQNDELLRDFMDAAHGADISREQFTAISDVYYGHMDKMFANSVIDPDAVAKGVSSDPFIAKNTIDGVNIYLNGIGLSPEEDAVMGSLMNNSDGIRALAKIMDARGVDAIPLGSQHSGDPTNAESMDEWNTLRNDPNKLQTDVSARKRFDELGKRLWG